MKQQTQKEEQVVAQPGARIATFQTGQDLKTALLIVSVLANVSIFTAWLVIQLTSRYDVALAAWLLG